jgi:hypothetical protein
MASLREQIYLAPAKPVQVKIPELPDAKIFVKILSGAEFDAYEAALEKAKIQFAGTRPFLVAATACDESGKLIFAAPEETAPVHTAILQRLFCVALDINGLTVAARERYEKNC